MSAVNLQPKVLIVDDTPANLQTLSQILSKQGYDVRVAPNGNRALNAAKASPPDVILLDIMMPEMDGFAVCEKLKREEQTKDIPVLFLSALGEMGDKIRAFQVGGVDYITKPFQIEETLARVQTHVSLRRARLELEATNRELHHALHRERQLNELSRALTSTTELNEIAKCALGLACNALKVDQCILWLFIPDKEYLESGYIFNTKDNSLIKQPDNSEHKLPEFFSQILKSDSVCAFDWTAQLNSFWGMTVGNEDAHLLGVPMWSEQKTVGILGFLRYGRETPFSDADFRTADSIGRMVGVSIGKARIFAEMQRLACTDILTGIASRGHFINMAKKEIANAHRYNRSLALILIDLDQFKKVNDTYGHDAGDEVLRVIAQTLCRSLRQGDFLGRYGGEEFVGILPMANLACAVQVAERLRQLTAKQMIAVGDNSIRITISIGVTELYPDIHDTLEPLLKRADLALYEAKKNGRDRVEAIA